MMTKALLVGTAGVVAAGALAIPFGINAVDHATASQDVALTGSGDALVTGMEDFYQELGKPFSSVLADVMGAGNALNLTVPAAGILVGLDPILPSGLLDPTENAGQGASVSALDPSTFANLSPEVVDHLQATGDVPWTTALADSMGMSSSAPDFTAVAGLLPNGVNFLFDQLAVDANNLFGGDEAPIITDSGIGGLLFTGLNSFDPSLATELATPGFEGDMTATLTDVLGLI